MLCLTSNSKLKKLRFEWLLAALILSLGTSGCSTLFAKKKSHSKTTHVAKNDSPLGFNADSEAEEDSDSDDSDDDETDVAGTEGKDETPEDVGDVQARAERSKEEIEADAQARKTFSLVDNEFVESWIRYFDGRGFTVMQKWLGRSTRYIPMMKQVLRDEGMPEDLIYLSMIESGFNPKAASRAKAVGPWQFIKSTGQRYGLKVNYWLDERRDYRKSTYAAAQYLKELHQIFGSWYLAAAAYNAGEGKVLTAVRKDRTRNFWELARKKKNFRAETRNYVPKIIAAALVSKNPEKHGFTNVAYENPLSWETITVPSGVDLRSVAQIIGEDLEHMQLLNSELRRGITPPGENGYELRVPPGKKETLAANLDKLQAKKIGNFVEHTVRRGDTLSSIARRYGTDVTALQELNQLTGRRSHLKIGRELVVPVGSRDADDSPSSRRRKSRRARASETAAAPAGKAAQPSAKPSSESTLVASAKPGTPAPGILATAANPGSYTVQPGDTLWSIAKKYGTTIQELKRRNNLRSPKSMRAGVVIQIPST